MKSYSAIHSRAVLATVCGIAFVLSTTAVTARADDWNKKTVLTVNRTIDVADTVLDPGQYVFRLLDSQSDRHVVQIFNGDQSHIIATVLAVPAYRMNPTSSSQFTFREIPGKAVMALHEWYYPGDNTGQEFPYPKHTANLEAALLPNPPSLAAPPISMAPASSDVTPAVPPIPEPTMAAQPNELPKDGADQPADQPQDQMPAVSQATEPQAQSADSTPPDSTPAALPKTSSPYPLIGLSGLLSLGAYALLRRMKQSA